MLLFLALIILTGLVLRMFAPPLNKPPGQLVDIGGFNLHIVASGEKNQKPTVVIENGAGLPTEYYHWLDKGLKDSLRVIRYDRAGMGHSDKLTTSRDAKTIAQELHTLLEKSGESPPYIMVGHSLGGPFIRVFSQMYPKEVASMFFLDATHHDQVKIFGAPEKSSFKFKLYRGLTEVQSIAGDLGIFILYEKIFGNPYKGVGLPHEINEQVKQYLSNGNSFRAYKEEMKNFHSILKRSGETNDFGDIPIRSYTAIKEKDNHKLQEKSNQKKDYLDFEDLSSNGKHIGIIGNHTTIFTKEENAKIICDEILNVANKLSPKKD